MIYNSLEKVLKQKKASHTARFFVIIRGVKPKHFRFQKHNVVISVTFQFYHLY